MDPLKINFLLKMGMMQHFLVKLWEGISPENYHETVFFSFSVGVIFHDL